MKKKFIDSEKPLVSIIVGTYNSSPFVLETLESVYDQTYQDIELIITDDGSTDNTVSICTDWVDKHKSRFTDVKLITSPHNTGIVNNGNRGLSVARGEWLKPIGGDDTMDINCIHYYLNYIYKSSLPIKIIHSNVNAYKNTISKKTLYNKQDKAADIFNHPAISGKQQYELLLRKNWIDSPSIFFRKDLFVELKGYDKAMPYEDRPFYLKVTKMNYKIYFLNYPTVNYRIHDLSVCNSRNNNKLIFNDFFIKSRVVYKVYRSEHLSFAENVFENLEFYRKLLFLKLKLNKKNLFNRALNKLFTMSNGVFEKLRISYLERKIMKEVNTNDIYRL